MSLSLNAPKVSSTPQLKSHDLKKKFFGFVNRIRNFLIGAAASWIYFLPSVNNTTKNRIAYFLRVILEVITTVQPITTFFTSSESPLRKLQEHVQPMTALLTVYIF